MCTAVCIHVRVTSYTLHAEEVTSARVANYRRITYLLTRRRALGANCFINRRGATRASVATIDSYLAGLNLSAAALRHVQADVAPVSPAVNAATVELHSRKQRIIDLPSREAVYFIFIFFVIIIIFFINRSQIK